MEQDLCFTVWVGQTEKEIRNIKYKTLVTDVISALLREHLSSIFVSDDRFLASLPYLCRNLKYYFVIRVVSGDGFCKDLTGSESILDLISNEFGTINYMLKMVEDAYYADSDSCDEIEIIKSILLQNQRIEEQNIILQNLDNQIKSYKVEEFNSHTNELEEFISISTKLINLQERIWSVEEEAIELSEEIENRRLTTLKPRLIQAQNCKNQRSQTLPRKLKLKPDANNYDFDKTSSDESYDSTFIGHDWKTDVQYSATLPRKPSYATASPQFERFNGHVPAYRRDIEPERKPMKKKWPSQNVIRRSVSDMNLIKSSSMRNIETKMDKGDSDSDTGISSLHSSDNEYFHNSSDAMKCETLV